MSNNKSIPHTQTATPTSNLPNTRVIDRAELFDATADMVPGEEETQQINSLMQQILGDFIPKTETEGTEEIEEQQEEQEFAFRLFSSKPATKVKIGDKDDQIDRMVETVASQQILDHDDTNPEFLLRISQSAVDYHQILKQSTQPYPTLCLPRRVIHISSQTLDEKPKKKRKSKKCRDFEKAVREGRIKVRNMRNPQTPGGWPGYPGHRTSCAIVHRFATKKKRMNR